MMEYDPLFMSRDIVKKVFAIVDSALSFCCMGHEH